MFAPFWQKQRTYTHAALNEPIKHFTPGKLQNVPSNFIFFPKKKQTNKVDAKNGVFSYIGKYVW